MRWFNLFGNSFSEQEVTLSIHPEYASKYVLGIRDHEGSTHMSTASLQERSAKDVLSEQVFVKKQGEEDWNARTGPERSEIS